MMVGFVVDYLNHGLGFVIVAIGKKLVVVLVGIVETVPASLTRRWQKKMHFLLTTLKVAYVLTTLMPELIEDDTVEAIRRRAKILNRLRSCRILLNLSTWQMMLRDFKHTLKHGKDDLSLVQLGSHVRIEESLRAQDSDKCKGKEVVGPSLNMTEEG
ncbi:hypothetical protein Tco_1371823, partial [Tanacetum coccineum]